MKYLMLITALFFSFSGESQVENNQGVNPLKLTEKGLLGMAKTSSPAQKALRAKKAEVDLAAAQLEAQYETRWNTSYSYAKSKEQGLASFIPVMSPTKNISTGLAKKLPYGVEVEAMAFGEQISTEDGTINRATRAGTKLSVNVDLLKNLFGRVDRNNLASQRYSQQIASYQASIDQKTFEINVRKIYWSLVANDQSLRLTEQLVLSAEKQLNDAKKRARAGAADNGDVARAKAQLEARKSSVFLFKYQKELLEASLKKLVPQLVDKTLVYDKSGIQPAIDGVLLCMNTMLTDPKPSEKYSDLYKILDLTKKEYEVEKSKATATGDWDLKLTSSVQYSGVNQGFDQAIDTYQEDKKQGYAVGLALSIPLEGDLKEAEIAHRRLVNQGYKGKIDSLELEIEETHKQIIKSLFLLKQAAVSQAGTVKLLNQSVKSSQRKYRQARVSINELVLEQDSLFNARLSEIDTRLSVIHALYDYFKVFNHYPCAINKI